MSKYCNNIILQNSSPKGRVISTQQESCEQLELFPLPKKRQKPQITSIPGVSPKERDRYRVMMGDRILGDKLSLDEAIKLAKRGGE